MRGQLFCNVCALDIIPEESKMGSKSCPCMCFGAHYILNGYVLGGQMEQAQNSDSKTHMGEISQGVQSMEMMSYFLFFWPLLIEN